MEIKAKNQISIVDVSDGKSVSSIVSEYYLSTSNIELSGGSWSTEIPARTKDTYIWTRSRVEFSNPTETAYTTAVLDNATNNMVAVGSVTEALNAELNIEGNTLVAKAGKLIIESPQLSLDATGNLDIDTNGLKLNKSGDSEFSGNIKASSGEFTKGFFVRVPVYKAVSDGEPVIDGYILMQIDENGFINAYESVDTTGETDDTAQVIVIDGGVSLYGDNGIELFSLGNIDIQSTKKLNFLSNKGITFKGNITFEGGTTYIGDTLYVKNVYIGEPDLSPLPLPSNSIDMTSYIETDITDTTNLPAKSVYAHKRYNSVTITCGASSPIKELVTANDYALIGRLPFSYRPKYNIIMYYRLSAAYFGQIQINTNGTVWIGQTRNNAGNAINYLVNKPMRWAFTYTI